MLVLSRKTNEKLVIGQGITVTIVRVNGQTVRIGIDAPPDVRIRRAELAELERDEPGEPPSEAAA